MELNNIKSTASIKTTPQTVNIVNRERIEVSGVLEVISSTDKEIYAKLEGQIAYISGEKMTITKLIPEEKLLSVTGKINGIVFKSSMQKKSFLKKVFK